MCLGDGFGLYYMSNLDSFAALVDPLVIVMPASITRVGSTPHVKLIAERSLDVSSHPISGVGIRRHPSSVSQQTSI